MKTKFTISNKTIYNIFRYTEIKIRLKFIKSILIL